MSEPKRQAASPVLRLSIAADDMYHAATEADEVAARTGVAGVYRHGLYASSDAVLESVMCHEPKSMADAALMLLAAASRMEEIIVALESGSTNEPDALTANAVGLALDKVSGFLIRTCGEDLSPLFKGRLAKDWRDHFLGEDRKEEAGGSAREAEAGDDAELERLWQERNHSVRLDRDNAAGEEHHMERISAAGRQIASATARTPRGLAIQLWLALSHTAGPDLPDDDIIMNEDLGAVLALDRELDVDARCVVAALRSLHASPFAGAAVQL